MADNKKAIQDLYQAKLGRQADTAGLDYWASQLDSGKSLDWVQRAIENTSEYKEKSAQPQLSMPSTMGRDDWMSPRNTYAEQIYRSQEQQKLLAMRQAQEQAQQALNERRRASDAAYQTGMEGLATTRERGIRDFAGMKNAADVQTAQKAAQLAEIMAQQGLIRGGQYASGQARVSTEGLQRQGQLDQAQGDFMTDIGNQESALERERAMQLANIAERAQLLQQQGIDAITALRMATEDQIAAEKMRNSYLYDEYAERRGDIDWERQYQLGRDQVMDNRYNQQWDYQLGRDQISDQRYDQEWEYRQIQDAFQRALQEAGLTGYYNNNPTFDRERFNADQQYRQQQLSLQRAKNSQTQPKYTPQQASIYAGVLDSMNQDSYEQLAQKYLNVTGSGARSSIGLLGNDLYNDYVKRLEARMEQLQKYSPKKYSNNILDDIFGG